MLNLTVRKMAKIWVIGDTHFGISNNSTEWQRIQQECFDNWLFPLWEKEVGENDVLVHLGDVFDDRQSVNVQTMNMAIGIFERLSEIFRGGVYILCGNHDMKNNKSNEVNSLACLKYIPRVNIITKPVVVHSLNNIRPSMALLPYTHDDELLNGWVSEHSGCDYIFAHAEAVGAKYIMGGSTSDRGIRYSGQAKLICGHIHLHQETSRGVLFVGTPYQLNFGDCGNDRGILVIDGKDMEFIENPVSPKFIRVRYSELSEREKDFAGNFVQVFVTNDEAISGGAEHTVAKLSESAGARDIRMTPADEVGEQEVSLEVGIGESGLELERIVEEYIGSLNYDDTTKANVLKLSKHFLSSVAK